jgi:uncharacterized small protein (DUF1192 family)
MKRPFQLVAEIQQKDAEIERLSARCAFMASNDYVYSLTSEIERLKALCARAADALQEEFGPPEDPDYGVRGPVHELIAELRKAVE